MAPAYLSNLTSLYLLVRERRPLISRVIIKKCVLISAIFCSVLSLSFVINYYCSMVYFSLWLHAWICSSLQSEGSFRYLQ